MTFQTKPLRSRSVHRSAVRRSARAFAATSDGGAFPCAPAIPSSIGNFEILGQLGSGGMGIVYEARDSEHGSPVALKTMKSAGVDRLMRFKGEFRYTASIAHPNLVSLYELGVADGTWFFTMEKVSGVTLDLDLADNSPPSALRPSVIADRFSQIVQGLNALHAAGLQHLDLKPSNVMVTPEGRVVVLDFGLTSLSRRRDPEDESALLGTVLYMSPEQALGEPTSGASDLYALGVMLYEALVGRCPHEDGFPNAMGMILLKTTKLPPHPSELLSLHPAAEALADLAVRLLAIDPDERPSAYEVLATLCRDRDEVPATPAPPPFVGRQNELRSLAKIVTDRPKDRPTVVHVRGLSGTGKSRLIEQFMRRLRQDADNVVLSARCHEYETIPYKGVDELVDQLVLHLRGAASEQRTALASQAVAQAAKMFPTLHGAVPELDGVPPPSPGADGRELAHAGLASLFAHVAAKNLLFLVLDDVQWSDAGAAQVLASLLKPHPPLPCVILIAYRSESAQRSAILQELQDLRQHDWFFEATVEVGVLEAEAAQELARSILGTATPEEAKALAHEAQRSPFLIEQLAVHQVREGNRSSLGTVVRDRYQALDKPARRLLRTAAVAGRPIEKSLLFEAAGVKDGRFLMARLARGSLLRVDGLGTDAQVTTYHDRIREGVLGALDPQTLQSCHAALAKQLLTHSSRKPHVLARHFHGAGAETEAARYAKEAGDEAVEALAFERAAEHYADALQWGGPDQPAVQELRCARADALYRAGRCDLAGPAFCEAASFTKDDRTRMELLRLGAEAMLSAGAVREAFKVLRPLFAEAGVPFPRGRLDALVSLAEVALRLRLRVRGGAPMQRQTPDEEAVFRSELCYSVGKGLISVAGVEGALNSLRSVLYGLDAGDARAATCGLFVAGSGFVPFMKGREDDFFARGYRVAEELQSDHLKGSYHLASCQRRVIAGNWDEAIEHGDLALELFERSHEPSSWEASMVRATISIALEYRGHLSEMRARCQEYLRLASERGDRTTQLRMSSGLAYTLAAADQLVALDRMVREIGETITSWGIDYGISAFYRLRLELLAMMRREQIEKALLLFDEEWPEMVGAHLTRIPLVRPAILHVKGALEAGALMRNGGSRLRRRVKGTRRQLQKVARADGPAFAIVLTAVLAADRGKEHEVRASLRAAAGAYRRGRQQVCAAMVEWVLAMRAGHHDAAAQFEAELAELGVVHPSTWANFHVPGLVPGS